ncbi:MAG TPA: class I SAM-dependent methyltransferase [Candidatus Limnocylindria bacterium]
MEWDAAYRGQPLWEIGRSQPAVVELAESGRLGHSVLDAGCGTGENALLLAERGHEVWGIDVSELAIERAMMKTHARRLPVVFLVANVVDADAVGRTFDSVVDSGCFHTLSDSERVAYSASMRALTEPGGSLHVLCFSELEPPGWGPRRVTQAELRDTFAEGWTELEIVPAHYETRGSREGRTEAFAWLASFRRTATA